MLAGGRQPSWAGAPPARATFEKELEMMREWGLARTDREEMDYVVGIAAPVFNFLDEPVAALNIWAPSNRCSLADLLAWCDDLKAGVSKLIGGSHEADPREQSEHV